jgi:hypothetical protein
MRNQVLVATAAALLVLTGCGGKGPGDPAEVVLTYYDALARGDAEAACSLLDPLSARATGKEVRGTCAKAYKLYFGPEMRAFADLETRQVIRRGASVTVVFRPQDVTRLLKAEADPIIAAEARQINGQWRVNPVLSDYGQPKVSATEQRSLPTDQYLLGSDLCADDTSGPGAQLPRLRAKGHRQLRALIAAYKKRPDALVRTSYALSDPEPNEKRVQHEYETLRELAYSHLTAADPANTFDAKTRACTKHLRTTLIKLLSS